MTHHIAIIGAGFSGVITLHHLIQTATAPLSIRIYDKTDNLAQGRAYKTKDIVHLLNVPAKKMG
ncbi:MAG: FAD/NAD(P)-binding protein, partial [Cytophagales bacterium]